MRTVSLVLSGVTLSVGIVAGSVEFYPETEFFGDRFPAEVIQAELTTSSGASVEILSQEDYAILLAAAKEKNRELEFPAPDSELPF